MKKMLVAALGLMAIVACTNDKPAPILPDGGQNDSLQRIIEQKDNEINDMMGTLNEIQEGFREINEAENRVNVVKDGERANKAQQIRENIQFISQRMAQNRELIKKLQQQMRESTVKGNEFESIAYNQHKTALKSVESDLEKICETYENECGDEVVKIQFGDASKLVSVLSLVGTENVTITFDIEENNFAKKVCVENQEVSMQVKMR